MTDKNQAEWLAVQHSYDKAEQIALALKVLAIIIWIYLISIDESLLLQIGTIGLFWLHEAIVKTQQSRAAKRLLHLEHAIRQIQDEGCQWHSQWQSDRPGALALITAYMCHALKPTVAITYVILLTGSAIRYWN